MGYDALIRNIEEFDLILSKLGLRLAADSPNKVAFDSTREFLRDTVNLPEDEWLAKWKPRTKEFYHSQIVVKRLVGAVVVLQDQLRLKSRLKLVLGGPLTQDFETDAAKDYFYELEMAAIWKKSGFTVELAEPDIVLSGHGLSAPVGVACKYPSSEKSLQDHVSKGYSQIARNGYSGLVAIGLDQLYFKGMSNFMDFRQGGKNPLEIMDNATSEFTTNLVRHREKNYPAELPIDGAMLTLSAVGIYGSPAKLTNFTHATLHCQHSNPRFADFGVLYTNLAGAGGSP